VLRGQPPAQVLIIRPPAARSAEQVRPREPSWRDADRVGVGGVRRNLAESSPSATFSFKLRPAHDPRAARAARQQLQMPQTPRRRRALAELERVRVAVREALDRDLASWYSRQGQDPVEDGTATGEILRHCADRAARKWGVAVHPSMMPNPCWDPG
jgi:hypothetical protein